MSFVDLQANPFWLNAAVFVIGCVMIWVAGTRLERCVDQIADQTVLGKAFLGLLLLAISTSLPEVATTVTATLSDNTSMAIHNLLGSVVMQTAVLALADLAAGPKALTGKSPHFSLLIQGVGLTALLAVALLGASLSGQMSAVPLLGQNIAVGIWSALLLGCYSSMLYLAYRNQGNPRWKPIFEGSHKTDPRSDGTPLDEQSDVQQKPLLRLWGYFLVASLVVLVAGWLVAQSGEAIAEQTGLGSSFVGFTLLALATSLPEISTTVSAARAGAYDTAFSNVFGSNALNVALLVLVAALSGGAAVLQGISGSGQFAAALGILLTCVYLWGLLERRDRSVLRLGYDSIAVLVFAVIGNVVIFYMR